MVGSWLDHASNAGEPPSFVGKEGAEVDIETSPFRAPCLRCIYNKSGRATGGAMVRPEKAATVIRSAIEAETR